MSFFKGITNSKVVNHQSNSNNSNTISEKTGILSSNTNCDIDTELIDTLMNLDNLNNLSVPKNMWGQKFENFLASLFKHAGYKVEKTSEAGKPDNGIDLIIEKDNEKIAIQAKNYRIDGVYSIDKAIVQNFIGAIEVRKDITSGAIITTHFFTDNAVTLHNNLSEANKKVELIDREKLYSLILKLYPELLAKAFFEKDVNMLPKCPICGSIAIKKKIDYEKKQTFYGCVKYPSCNCPLFLK